MVLKLSLGAIDVVGGSDVGGRDGCWEGEVVSTTVQTLAPITLDEVAHGTQVSVSLVCRPSNGWKKPGPQATPSQPNVLGKRPFIFLT